MLLVWLARILIQAAIGLLRLEIRMALDTSKLTDAINTLSANVDKLIAAESAAQPAVDAATSAVSAVNDKVTAALPPA